MKFTRSASAHWEGSGKEGNGTVSTQSTVLSNTQYSFSSRFEEGIGTNPEELVGAAHAGCFTMKLSFVLGSKGFEPTRLDTTAKVNFEDGAVVRIDLDLVGEVPGISAEEFQACAEEAKNTCPISQLLNTEIGLSASLKS